MHTVVIPLAASVAVSNSSAPSAQTCLHHRLCGALEREASRVVASQMHHVLAFQHTVVQAHLLVQDPGPPPLGIRKHLLVRDRSLFDESREPAKAVSHEQRL